MAGELEGQFFDSAAGLFDDRAGDFDGPLPCASDTLSLTLPDPSTNEIFLGRTDAVDVSLDDLGFPLVMTDNFDTLDAAISEGVSEPFVMVTPAEDLDLNFTLEHLSTAIFPFTEKEASLVLDVQTIEQDEFIRVSLSRSETLQVAIAEGNVAVIGLMALVDDLDISAEDLAAAARAISVNDEALVSAADVVLAMMAQIGVSEDLAVKIVNESLGRSGTYVPVSTVFTPISPSVTTLFSDLNS